MSKNDDIYTSLLDAYCREWVDDEEDYFFAVDKEEEVLDPMMLYREFCEDEDVKVSNAADEVELQEMKAVSAKPQSKSTSFLNDSLNTDDLVEYLEGEYVYDTKLKCWRYFDGCVWSRIEKTRMQTVATECFRERFNKTKGSEELLKHFNKSCNKGQISSALELAKGRDGIERLDFDIDQRLVCVSNGVLNLENGELLDHDADYWQTRKIDVNYDPTALEGSRFSTFLWEISGGDDDWIEYLQIVFGSALLALPQQQFYLLHGDGANGKSVLIEAIATAFRDFQIHLPASELIAKQNKASGHSAFFAKSIGKRFMFSSELPEGKSLNEAFVKNVTGGSELSLRDVGEKAIEFLPEFVLFMDTNALPPIAGRDWGIKRRAVVIPFTRIFAPYEQDFSLKRKLAQDSERAAILAWVVEGAIQVASNPHLIYEYPAIVDEVTSIYREQVPEVVQHELIVEEFVTQCLNPVAGEKIQASKLHEHYKRFCIDNGYPLLKQKKFGSMVRNFLGEPERESAGKFYLNIALKQEMKF